MTDEKLKPVMDTLVACRCFLLGLFNNVHDGDFEHDLIERIKKAEASLADLDSTDGWQPIESAPKDRSRILLYVPPYGPTTGHFDCYWDDFNKERWVMHSVLNKDAQPTHWRPLPAPPTPTGER